MLLTNNDKNSQQVKLDYVTVYELINTSSKIQPVPVNTH